MWKFLQWSCRQVFIFVAESRQIVERQERSLEARVPASILQQV